MSLTNAPLVLNNRNFGSALYAKRIKYRGLVRMGTRYKADRKNSKVYIFTQEQIDMYVKNKENG